MIATRFIYLSFFWFPIDAAIELIVTVAFFIEAQGIKVNINLTARSS